MISMTPRKDISLQRTLLTPLVSILMTLCVGATIFVVLGYDALASLYQFFIAPLSRPDQVADLFVKACPLIITATGLVFCYRANVWNIGAEGQIVMGAGLCRWCCAVCAGSSRNSADASNDPGCDYRRHGMGADCGYFKSAV